MHHGCYAQRTEVLHALGSEEEFHASMSIVLPSEPSTITEESSVTLLDISMASESRNQQEGVSFIQGYHSMYSLVSDAEVDDHEDGIDDNHLNHLNAHTFPCFNLRAVQTMTMVIFSQLFPHL